MEAAELAVKRMEDWAADPSHGYDQEYRWGERGDFDCSAAVIQAWELAGVPVKSNGATYTGNMRGVFLRCGFRDVTGGVELGSGSGLLRGDVLLNYEHHTAMYCGNGQEVEASINENGTVTALVKRADYRAERSERFVDETFSGSLPAFVTAFTARKKLSREEIDELQSLIDSMRG